MARAREKLIRSPSPKGAGGGCIDPGLKIAAERTLVSIKTMPAGPPFDI
jgi:hypothetical protein